MKIRYVTPPCRSGMFKFCTALQESNVPWIPENSRKLKLTHTGEKKKEFMDWIIGKSIRGNRLPRFYDLRQKHASAKSQIP